MIEVLDVMVGRAAFGLGLPVLLALVCAALVVVVLHAAGRALGEAAGPPPLAEMEEGLRQAGTPLLRLLGGVFCLVGGLFLTLAAEAAEVAASTSPSGLLLGAAVFVAVGLRCLWLARSR